MKLRFEHSKPRILLFDIDGTLLLSGGAGRRAINRTFAELFGIADAFAGIVPDGNTDPLIFREIVTRSGLGTETLERRWPEIEERYRRHMEHEMRRSPGARLMPGVTELLTRLHGREHLHLGLLTGNLEPTARMKLDRFGLNRFFGFGAFGSDDADRNRLAPIAVRRAEARLDRPIGLGRHVFVIGDTPKDVACALAAGVTAVGVASANYSQAELESAGAHVTLSTLEAPAPLLDAIDG